MTVTRRATFRIYPTPTQASVMDEWLEMHRELYNAALQERRDAWKRCKVSVSVYDQMRQLTEIKPLRPEFRALGIHSLQFTLRKVDLAYQAFFRRHKAGQNPGYPRFKGKAFFRGWSYPDHDTWKLQQATPGKHGSLVIRGLGKLRIRGKARDWGNDTTLTLTRDGEGLWFASVTVDCEPVRHAGDEAIGLDWGVEAYATLSTGERVENPRLLRKAETRLKLAQRDLSRKVGPDRRRKAQKPSQRWLKAKERLRVIHREVANRRKEFRHQLSAKLIQRAALLATEALNLMGMTASAKGAAEKPGKKVKQKAGLNRAILDTAPGEFLKMLAYKAEEAGTHLHLLEPREWKPSQTCPGCGAQSKKPLKMRLHACPACGFTAHRDHASALVMINVALLGKAWEPGLRGEVLVGSPARAS
ncbi:MAG: transposase [Holophagaceae bacterium]